MTDLLSRANRPFSKSKRQNGGDAIFHISTYIKNPGAIFGPAITKFTIFPGSENRISLFEFCREIIFVKTTMEATADQAIAKLKGLFIKAISTLAVAKDRTKGKANEKISETAWWFPMFASSTCTSLASCLGSYTIYRKKFRYALLMEKESMRQQH